MSDQLSKHVDAVLETVSPSRRDFLRKLLLAGAATATLAPPASQLLAEDAAGDGKGKGKGDGEGKGKGKGDGGGKGKSKGKGKGKGGSDGGAGGGKGKGKVSN